MRDHWVVGGNTSREGERPPQHAPLAPAEALLVRLALQAEELSLALEPGATSLPKLVRPHRPKRPRGERLARVRIKVLAQPALRELTRPGVQVILPQPKSLVSHSERCRPLRTFLLRAPGQRPRRLIRFRLPQQSQALEAFPQHRVRHLAGTVEPHIQHARIIRGKDEGQFTAKAGGFRAPRHRLHAFLLLNVLFDDRQRRASTGCDKRAIRPQRRQPRAEGGEFLAHQARRAAFDQTHEPVDAELRVTANQEMHMIGHDVQFNHLSLTLGGNLANNGLWNVCSIRAVYYAELLTVNCVAQALKLPLRRSAPRLKAGATAPIYLV